jgi:hypothetical protein
MAVAPGPPRVARYVRVSSYVRVLDRTAGALSNPGGTRWLVWRVDSKGNRFSRRAGLHDPPPLFGAARRSRRDAHRR